MFYTKHSKQNGNIFEKGNTRGRVQEKQQITYSYFYKIT